MWLNKTKVDKYINKYISRIYGGQNIEPEELEKIKSDILSSMPTKTRQEYDRECKKTGWTPRKIELMYDISKIQ